MIKTAIYTDIGGRSCNEDSARVREWAGSVLAVVADGLGGHGGGDRASALAADTLKDGWDGSVATVTLEQLIRRAHNAILPMQTRQCQMKTTIVALTVRPGFAAWAHAGDSRLYHFSNGRLVFQSKDHSASQIAVSLGQITTAQIRFHEDRSRVFRALGQNGPLTVEAHDEALTPGSHVWLLCTDGFWEYVLEEEMQADLAVSADPEEWLARMSRRLQARAPADNDNNTAVAVWLD